MRMKCPLGSVYVSIFGSAVPLVEAQQKRIASYSLSKMPRRYEIAESVIGEKEPGPDTVNAALLSPSREAEEYNTFPQIVVDAHVKPRAARQWPPPLRA